MYTFICTRGLRNFRYNETLLNCRCQYKKCYQRVPNKTCHYNQPLMLNNVRHFSSIYASYNLTYKNALLPYPCRDTYSADLLTVRHLSVTSWLADKEPLKPSSKVEVTVQALKKEQQNKESVPAEAPPKAVVKKTIKQRIVSEILHYYHGFRLLFIDIKVSGHLVWRILNGKSLSRRENRLLVRTVGDLFRLLPFSVFIVVPFMEFLLPFAIKIFPGMLPSTFQTSSEREDKLKKSLKVKLEMAKFLQQTLDEMSVQHTDRSSQSAKDFAEWFAKVRTSGQEVSNEDIMKFAKLFQDEITLDSLSRGQLVALCRVLEVQTLGTNNLLRFQLRMKLRSLAADDKLIQKEGVESLTIHELQQACKARGMRAYGMPEERLKTQLTQWLDLSLNQKVPPSLLLLSRALMLPETIPTSDKLKATISVLPDTIVAQTKAAIAESEGKVDNKVKLEVLKDEVRKVKEEREEHREELKRKKEVEKKDKETIVDKAPVIDTSMDAEFPDCAKVCTTTEKITEPKKKETQISSKDLGVLEHAIETLAKGKKQLILEKEGIEELKEEMADYQEDLQELNEICADKPKAEIKESKAAKRLFNRVNKMIKKMDTVVSELENKEQQLKKDLASKESTVTQEDIVRIDELLDAIKQLRKVPDQSVLEQIQNILGRMDDDRDGSIKVEDVLKVIEVIGKENVQLSAKQIDEVMELIDKEEILEVEDKIEKALQKEKSAEKKTAETIADDKSTVKENPIGDPCISKMKSDAQSAAGITPPPSSIDKAKGKGNSKSL